MRRILIATAIAGAAFMTPAVAHADTSISGLTNNNAGLNGVSNLGNTLKGLLQNPLSPLKALGLG